MTVDVEGVVGAEPVTDVVVAGSVTVGAEDAGAGSVTLGVEDVGAGLLDVVGAGSVVTGCEEVLVDGAADVGAGSVVVDVVDEEVVGTGSVACGVEDVGCEEVRSLGAEDVGCEEEVRSLGVEDEVVGCEEEVRSGAVGAGDAAVVVLAPPVREPVSLLPERLSEGSACADLPAKKRALKNTMSVPIKEAIARRRKSGRRFEDGFIRLSSS